MYNFKERIIVFDFETSGLSADKNQPIEMAAKSIELDGSIREFQCLVKCPEPLHPRIIEITSITDDMLSSDGIEYDEAFKLLAAFIGYDQDDCSPYLVGHNWIKFDIGFLAKGLIKIGIDPIPESKGWDTAGHYKSMKIPLFERLKGEKLLKFQHRALNQPVKGLMFNLTLCCQEYEIPLVNAHRAMGDVEATLRVYLKQTDRINQTDHLTIYLNNYDKDKLTPGIAGTNENISNGSEGSVTGESTIPDQQANPVQVEAGSPVNDRT